MPTIIIPAVLDTETRQVKLDAVFEAGDVKIKIGSGSYANTSNPTPLTYNDAGAGSGLLDLELSNSEYVDSALFLIKDQTVPPEFETLEVYDVVDDNETLIALLQQNPATNSPNRETKTAFNGDTFNGSAMPQTTFAVTIDATGANSVALVIFDKDVNTIYKQVSCTATSTVLITADAYDIDFGSSLTFAGCPEFVECQYAVVATTSGKDATIASGSYFIYNRMDPT